MEIQRVIEAGEPIAKATLWTAITASFVIRILGEDIYILCKKIKEWKRDYRVEGERE